MKTFHDIEQERGMGPPASTSLHSQDTVQEASEPPVRIFPQPPQQPPRPRGNRWVVIGAVVLALALMLSLGVLLIPGLLQRPASQGSPAATPPAATVPTTPAPTTPGPEVTPTLPPGVTPGPQTGPSGVSDPAYWDPLLSTKPGVNKVESVSFANIMGTPVLQALVTVRYTGTDARLDVYVFTNITSAHPRQLFKLTGLVKGDARISGYNTVMTAEVDKNSTLNAGKAASAMTLDLFREFAWSGEEDTLVQVAFPGLFPDLTRYQAEADQARINQGQDTWKNDPQKVARALVSQFFDWQRLSSTTLLGGGGPRDISATVRVQETPVQGAQSQGPSIIVTLSRLEGNTHNFWVVIAVEDATVLTLTNIDARQLITSPVTLEGTGAAFEAVIGRAVVYDHLYTDIGHAQVTGNTGMGKANYSTKVIYTSSFRTGVQEGIVAVFEDNGGISSEIYSAVMVKVLLNPEPGVALGPLPCPDAVSNPV